MSQVYGQLGSNQNLAVTWGMASTYLDRHGGPQSLCAVGSKP
jgi:hypothetical protein